MRNGAGSAGTSAKKSKKHALPAQSTTLFSFWKSSSSYDDERGAASSATSEGLPAAKKRRLDEQQPTATSSSARSSQVIDLDASLDDVELVSVSASAATAAQQSAPRARRDFALEDLVCSLLHPAVKHYSYLLYQYDLYYIQTLMEQDMPSLSLLVRMLRRKTIWFSPAELSKRYAERLDESRIYRSEELISSVDSLKWMLYKALPSAAPAPEVQVKQEIITSATRALPRESEDEDIVIDLCDDNDIVDLDEDCTDSDDEEEGDTSVPVYRLDDAAPARPGMHVISPRIVSQIVGLIGPGICQEFNPLEDSLSVMLTSALTADELRQLFAKMYPYHRLQANYNKYDLVEMIASGNVKALDYARITRYVGVGAQASSSAQAEYSHEYRVYTHVTSMKGKIIRINKDLLRIVKKLDMLIFIGYRLPGPYRWDKLALARSGRLLFPLYHHRHSTTALFPTRENFEEYVYAQFVSDKIFRCGTKLVDSKLISSALRGLKTRTFSPMLYCADPAYIYAMALDRYVDILYRCKQYGKAVEILQSLLKSPFAYQGGTVTRWTIRTSVNLYHLGNIEHAIDVCNHIITTSNGVISEGDRALLENRVAALSSKKQGGKGKKKQAAPAAVPRGGKLLQPYHLYIKGSKASTTTGTGKSQFIGYDDQSVSVEELALYFYERRFGMQGLHSENDLLLTLFGIIMYDILFDSMTHMFYNAYQDKPLDLMEQAGNFFARRKNAVEDLLKRIELDVEEAITLLGRNFVVHKDERIEGVNWKLVEDWRVLAHICRGRALSVLLRMIAQDYASLRKGMPDLILFKPLPNSFATELQGSSASSLPAVIFAEVKSPRDRLSAPQEVWIHNLLGLGLTVHVLHVHETVKSNVKYEDDGMNKKS